MYETECRHAAVQGGKQDQKVDWGVPLPMRKKITSCFPPLFLYSALRAHVMCKRFIIIILFLFFYIVFEENLEREREGERQTDRQTETERQRDRDRERQRQRETETETERAEWGNQNSLEQIKEEKMKMIWLWWL